MKRRYAVAVSAMILAAQLGGPSQADEPTLRQLETISSLLDSNDVRSLRLYLSANRDLLDGSSELSQLLSDFMDESDDVAAVIGVRRERPREDEGAERIRDIVAARRDADDQIY